MELMPPPALPDQPDLQDLQDLHDLPPQDEPEAPQPVPLLAINFPHPDPLPPTARPVPVGRRDGNPDWIEDRRPGEVFSWDRKTFKSDAAEENARYKI